MVATDVIFTTTYDHHAIKAFEVNALDYLLQPIAPRGQLQPPVLRDRTSLIRRSLNSIERQLDPQVVFRANRRQLFNLNWIESTHQGSMAAS